VKSKQAGAGRVLAALRRLVPGKPVPQPAAAYREAVQASIRLDDEVGHKLDEAVARTEDSALAIMQQVRTLCDRSQELAGRLQAASGEAAGFEDEIAANVGALAQMTTFLECLPERLRRDLDSIRQIAEEIRSLSGLAESVQTISMQSHLLSINAAIEASRAGAAGQAFKVVADEVRGLAANSHAAATRIGGSLARINDMLRQGLEQNAAQSACDLGHISETAQAVTRLRTSFDRIAGSYHARFIEMQELGETLSFGASEVLGQLQYQDVVRQCVERLRAAVAQRNLVLGGAFGSPTGAPDAALLAGLLGDVVEEYLAGEALHGGTPDEGGGGLAIELF
jgi:methyl-accepting chemotaxis protein